VELLGGVYIIRYIVKTFIWKNGEEVHEEGHIHPLMVVAPAFTVIASIILGLLFIVSIQPYLVSLGLSASYTSLDLISLIGALVGLLLSLGLYLNGIDMGRTPLQPLTNFLYYGWYVNPILDLLGLTSFKFAQGLYNNFEHGVIDMGLNVKLPQGIINVGTSLVKVTDTGILRDYILLYLGGFVVLIFILIIIMGV